MVALLIVGGIVVIGTAAAGVALYKFSTSDVGKTVMSVAMEAANAGKGAGPDALRAAGCTQGVAIRYDAMNDKLKPLLADAGPNIEAAFQSGTEVRCMNPTKPITCDDVARIFVSAEHPTGTFNAIVSASGQDRCNVKMTSDGTPAPQQPTDAGAPTAAARP